MNSLRWFWWVAALAVLGAVVLRGQFASSAEKDAKEDAGPTGRQKEIQLVERLLAARKEYQKTLELLRKHYINVGDLPRARWAEDELLQYHRTSKHAFVEELEVPPATLKGLTNIRKANDLFRFAMNYKDKGWGTDYVDNQRRAEILLQRLLTEYPQSDKISDAAYQLGDLYEGRAFKQFERAAWYYERCFQWNPKTHHDARIRAARLYDRELNKHDKAREIYKLIQQHETHDGRIEEATKRMQELSNRR